MTSLIKEYDLNKPIKSQTFKLTKDSENKITFKNDIMGQVVKSESGNNIVFTVYKTQERGYQYTRVIEKYEDITSTETKVTTTRYIYTQEGNDWIWKQTGKSTTSTINPSEKPALPDGRNLWVIYTMSSKNSSSTSSSSMQSSSYFSASDNPLAPVKDKLSTIDGIYKTRVIDKFGLKDVSLTEDVMAKIILKNGNVATSIDLKSDKNESYSNVLDATFAPVRKGNKYTGTFLNESATSSAADETFSLKTGKDSINYAFFDGQSKVGNDIINLAKDEILTLNMLNSTNNQTTSPRYEEAELYINTAYAKKGNNLIMKFTDNNGLALGQTTIKNYFKIAQDNITLKYSGASSSVVDYENNLKELLELEDGIGILGNEEAETAQKITGNFLDNIILGGKGNDTIKGVAGDNFVIAGKGDDKLYSGKDADSFFIYRNDATGTKGDMVYNADKSDSIYFYDSIGKVDVDDDGKLTSGHYEFTKTGNTLTINYNDKTVLNSKDDKVTFVDYFKKNTELFNINDIEDYSTLTIKQQGKNNKAAKFYDTKYNDYISGGSKNDKYYFTQGTAGGTDTAVDVNGNDTYNVASLSNSLIIDDKAGTKDKLIVSDTNGYSLYFDITINGSNAIENVGKDLHIYKENTHANGVTISKHIDYSDNTVKTGAGCIESIKVGNSTLNIDVNKIANSVAGWLADKGYTSTSSVFTDHTSDIEAMLNVYTTGEYTPPNP